MTAQVISSKSDIFEVFSSYASLVIWNDPIKEGEIPHTCFAIW